MTATFESVAGEHKLSLRDLITLLLEAGVMSARDSRKLEKVANGAGLTNIHPLTYLSEQKLGDDRSPGSTITMDVLLGVLAAATNQQLYRVDPLKVNVGAVADVMSLAFAQRHKILAVEVNEDEVVITSAEPYITVWESNLEHVLRKPIRRVLTDPREIDHYTTEFYTMARSVRGARDRSQEGVSIGNLEQLVEVGGKSEPDVDDQHVVNIVDWLLGYAFEQRASDIHIEPRRGVGNVRFRIDGVLNQVYELPADVAAAVTSRFKILGRMDVAEKRRPQDGRLKTSNPDGDEIELRLSTLPTAFGEKLVMRIFDPDVLLKSFNELGLANEDLRRWHAMTATGNGIVLVTGPTGSGKTTTLYSTLRQLATPEVNVCTIEDPIEMVEGAFNQTQVKASLGLDFASGVRTLLRQDPDIIMIGEIRDLETADMAIQAALTGHLVISSLHTNDSPRAITRLLELGVPAYLIKATFRGVMAQRLVRILCSKCKVEDVVDEEAWQQMVQPFKVAAPKKTYRAVGCKHCRDSGYYGRQGLYEVLVMSEEIQELITDHTDIEQVRHRALKEGMRTLRLSGAARVASGETTIAEVLRVTPKLGQ
ncbi:MAG: general secretion pathway protein E [Halieaceae bacterium]|jgi:general secretion pathway protein E